jgi:cytochrome c oxidase subunit II
VVYEGSTPSRQVVAANEVHVPIGRPIVLKMSSRDVVHSFWAPNLLGKRDLIPGYSTAIWFHVDRAGVYHGQCAEFCGRQHAHMAFEVVAESEADFQGWLDRERQVAREPQATEPVRGKQLFMGSRCSGCHTIRGTDASGQAGPDLTHVGGRESIGSSVRPNTRQHLLEWLSNPHALKPGNYMPANPLAPSDLDALVAYLESLT